MKENKDQNGEPSFEELLDQYTSPAGTDFRRGERVTGKVVEITPESVFVDFGGRSEGSVAAEELLDEQGRLKVQLGDQLELVIASTGSRGTILTRGLKLKGSEAKAVLREAHANEVPVEGTVSGVNRGGYDVNIGGVRTFCPMSQMDTSYVTDPDLMVGLKGQFRVIEYGEGGRRIVVSRRVLLEEQAEAARQELMRKLEPGAVLPGQVTRLEPFGAFVELGGLEGLIHISELSRRRVAHPGDVLRPGETVEVQVLRVETDDRERTRVGLSLKALEPDPWENDLGFEEGQILTGTVRRLQPFGAFVELLPGVDGLVHVSEISYDHVRDPSELLEVGQEVRVMVQSIDRGAQRISLSIRNADEPSPGQIQEAYQPPPPDEDRFGTALGDALRKSLEEKQ